MFEYMNVQDMLTLGPATPVSKSIDKVHVEPPTSVTVKPKTYKKKRYVHQNTHENVIFVIILNTVVINPKIQ